MILLLSLFNKRRKGEESEMTASVIFRQKIVFWFQYHREISRQYYAIML